MHNKQKGELKMKRKKAIMLAENDEEMEKGKRTISDFKAVNKFLLMENLL